MDYDYNFGNDYYKYYGTTGVKSTVYNIMASEQSQNVQPGMEYLMTPLPVFDNPNTLFPNELCFAARSPESIVWRRGIPGSPGIHPNRRSCLP